MPRFHTLAAIAALGLSVSACATGENEPLSATHNPSLYSVHQPVVQRTDYVIDLAAGGEGLSPAERQRLAAWFVSIGASYGDRVSVDDGDAYAGAAARTDVARVAEDFGVTVSDGAPVTAGAVPPGSIRVVASRSTASVPGCPAYSRSNLGPSSQTSTNYGCATNSNLAAMIANPEDLVLGQDGTTRGSGTTATRAVRTYRERQPTGRQPLPSTSTTQPQGRQQ